MTRKTKNVESVNMNDDGFMEGFSEDNIQLRDGTTLNMRLNEVEYESDTKIDKSIFTSENLSNVTINGEKQGRMVLHSFYDFGSGTRFTLRKPTEIEMLREENNLLLNALAEVYELLLGSV